MPPARVAVTDLDLIVLGHRVQHVLVCVEEALSMLLPLIKCDVMRHDMEEHEGRVVGQA